MAKELIISANVHEKKVAIVEDGQVTEFYVERRDENQGVVVIRVKPEGGSEIDAIDYFTEAGGDLL